jgi:predicted nuclease of restriction endonuclease-like RecB superfamily
MAQDVCVTLKNLSIQQKRQVMRRLKFQRLMSEVEVDVDSKTLRLDLSGPLKIFGKAQGYSLRIASFFPFVASLPEWTLDATLTWKTKKVTLNLDETCGVQAHSNRTHGGYIPEEFQAVLQSFKDDGEFSLMAGEDFVHIGKQSYCFPDFKVKSKSFDFGIELFHAWHKGQARHRIQTASSLSARGLLIGIERSLLKDKDLKALCESDPWFAKYGFEFTQFPTPNVLKRVLKRYE